MGDSLDSSQRLRPSLTTDPKIYGYGLKKDAIASEPKSHHTTSSILASIQYNKNPEEYAINLNESYIELQYHGNVTAKQIESITFAHSQEAYLYKATIIDAINQGIKVYVYIINRGLVEITKGNITTLL